MKPKKTIRRLSLALFAASSITLTLPVSAAESLNEEFLIYSGVDSPIYQTYVNALDDNRKDRIQSLINFAHQNNSTKKNGLVFAEAPASNYKTTKGTKSPTDWLKDPDVQKELKDDKKYSKCLDESYQDNAVNWIGSGCSSKLKTVTDKKEKEEKQKDMNTFTKFYHNTAKDALKNIGKQAAAAGIDYLIDQYLNKTETHYYARGLQSTSYDFTIGNRPTPYKNEGQCSNFMLERTQHEHSILAAGEEIDSILQNLQKGDIDELTANGDIKEQQERIQEASAEIDDLDANAEKSCEVSSGYTTKRLRAIGYTDGSIAVYEVDLNPGSSHYNQPLVKSSEKCDLDENDSDACSPAYFQYLPYKDIKDSTGSSRNNLPVSKISALPLIIDNKIQFDQAQLIVGYGKDAIVTKAVKSQVNLQSPDKSKISYGKQTDTKGGLVALVTVSNDLRDEKNLKINQISPEEKDYAVNDLYTLERVNNLSGKLDQYVVIRKEAQEKSTDNSKYDFDVAMAGPVPIPVPTVSVLTSIWSAVKPETTYQIKYNARGSKSDIDYEIPGTYLKEVDTQEKWPTVSFTMKGDSLFLGYKDGKVRSISPNTGEFMNTMSIGKLASDTVYKDIYSQEIFSGSGCNTSKGCGESISFGHYIPKDNLLLYGSSKELVYLKYGKRTNTSGYTSIIEDAGGYNVQNEKAFNFDGKYRSPVSYFELNSRQYLVLSGGYIIGFEYAPWADSNQSLVFDKMEDFNNSVPQVGKKYIEKMGQISLADDSKTLVFTSKTNCENESYCALNVWQSEGYGLTSKLTDETIEKINHFEYLDANTVEEQYYGNTFRDWNHNKKSNFIGDHNDIKNIHFTYDDSLTPTGLTFNFGEAHPHKNAQLKNTGALFSVELDSGLLQKKTGPAIGLPSGVKLLQHNNICTSVSGSENETAAEVYCGFTNSGLMKIKYATEYTSKI